MSSDPATKSNQPPFLANTRRLRRRRKRPTALAPAGGLSGPESTCLDPPTPMLAVPGYEVVKVLGQGGMGVVYLAYHRDLKRQVALKSITNLALNYPSAIARFQSEAETLARLQHPNIVQVYDCGSSKGHPFLAMEYVPGGSLDQLLEAGRPTPRRTAELIAVTARAVHHAHEQGIIHRDLKPGNILMTPDGQPKVADFGLARNLSSSNVTQTGCIVGTPLYMAPEQMIAGKPLTPAVDTYALGVLLYEMLTGVVPFAGDQPEQVLGQVLRREVLPLRTWQPNLDRDLETICLKCLQKEPHQRYPTAEALAEDLQRYLDGRPILARPVGRGERAWRWCRRNPVAAVLAAGVAISLAVGMAASLSLAGWALGERAQARAAADAEAAARKEAEAVAEMLESVFAGFRPDGGDLRRQLKRLLDQAASNLEKTNDPQVRARLQNALVQTLLALGEIREAAKLLDRVVADRSEVLGRTHPDTLKKMGELSRVCCQLGQDARAVALAEEVVANWQAQGGPDHRGTLRAMRDLANLYREVGRGADSLQLHEATLSRQGQVLGPNDPDTLRTLSSLAFACSTNGQKQKGVRCYEEALARRLATLGPDHPDTLKQRNDLAVGYGLAGQHEQSVAMYHEALAGQQAVLGPDHPETLATLGNLAGAYRLAGQREEARTRYEQAQERYLAVFGPDHPNTLECMHRLSRVYQECGDSPQALKAFEATYARFQGRYGAAHPRTDSLQRELISVYEQFGQPGKAETLYRDWLARAGKRPETDPLRVARLTVALGTNLLTQRKPAEAEPVLRDGYQKLKDQATTKRPAAVRAKELAAAAGQLVRLYEELGRADEVSRWQQEREAVAKQ